MKKNFIFALTIFLSIQLTLYSQTKKEELLIATASSLTDVIQKIGAEYEKENNGIKILYSFGSSGVLKNQIEKGAGVDPFAFASLSDGKYLEGKNLLKSGSLKIICRNTLVLVINKKDTGLGLTGFESLKSDKIKKIAIGNFETVPAGKYAKDLLIELKIFDAVKDKFVFADNVRQALTYVELGNADAALVYKTDFLISKNLIIIGERDRIAGNEILDPAGITKFGENKKSAEKLFDFLSSLKAKKIFKEYGFKTE